MSMDNSKGVSSFTTVNHTSHLYRNISLVSAQCSLDDSGSCRGDWIYINCVSDPSFVVFPLEPYSEEFLDIERAGLEFIRENFKDLGGGGYFLSFPAPLNPEKNVLLFQRLLDPHCVQIFQELNFESFKNLPGAQIAVFYRLVGFDGKNYEEIIKNSRLWKFIENRVLVYLYFSGETTAWSYELNEIQRNWLYLSPRKSS